MSLKRHKREQIVNLPREVEEVGICSIKIRARCHLQFEANSGPN